MNCNREGKDKHSIKAGLGLQSARQIGLELDRADEVVLKVKQFRANVQDNAMLRGITVKAFTAISEKLHARLTDEKVFRNRRTPTKACHPQMPSTALLCGNTVLSKFYLNQFI